MSGFAARLAHWAAEQPPFRDPAVLGQARLSFIDTVGCMIGGGGEAPVTRARAAVGEWGTGEVGLPGLDGALSPPWAALVGGTAAHALDFDDNLEPALGHASAVLVPALLAAGGQANGLDLLDAYAVGIEVMSRLGLAMNMEHYSAGWHATVTLGTPAAAAALGRLRGFDAGQMRNAMSIASSMSGASKIQFGTGLKPVHAGLAAKSGVLAAALAGAGLDAAPEPFAGRWGLSGLMNGPAAEQFEEALRSLGTDVMLLRYGLMRKIYPSCAAMHRAVDGIVELVASGTVRADEVSSLRVLLAEVQTQNLRYPEPATPSEARFSLEYCMASALIDGSLGPAAFHPAALHRPDVRALAQRVRMETDPELPGTLPPDAPTPATLHLTLRDGRTMTHRVLYQRGHERNPLAAKEIAEKFRLLTVPVVGEDRARAALELLHAPDQPGWAGRLARVTARAGGEVRAPVAGAAPPA